MKWLFIIGLCALVAKLWHRLDQLSQQVRALDERLDSAIYQIGYLHRRAAEGLQAAGAVAPEAEPAKAVENAPPARVSVPVALRREEADLGERLAQDEPAPRVELVPEPEPLPAAPRFRFDFEDIFGRRLPIWAGGVTLAVAGVFLVRYSIERGLITPTLRVVMAFIFGFGLIAAAEAANRLRERVADPRVAQALGGAGLATLYAGFYLAGSQYGLIGQTLAFLGLAAVTAGAIALSFRFGLPSAVLGLVGGFAAPALVGGDEANLPLLALYLALVTGGLSYAAREQRREWMRIAALIGGLGWGAVLLLSGTPSLGDLVAVGLYLVVVGVFVPLLAGSDRLELPVRFAAALVASIELALLVRSGGYAFLAWGLYLLLGAALAFFAWRDARLREASGIAAAVAVVLLASWPDPAGGSFLAVAGALAGVFALVPLAHAWRGDERGADLLQLGLVPLALAAVAYAQFGDFFADAVEGQLALATLALAAIPALAARPLWQRTRPLFLAGELAIAAVLVLAAGWMVTPAWMASLIALGVFAVFFWVLRNRSEREMRALLWGAATITLVALFGHDVARIELARMGGAEETALGLRSLLRWIAPLAAFAALAWRETGTARHIADALAVALAYAALAQVVPADALAWTAAALAVAAAFTLPERLAARGAVIGIAALWALEPGFQWLGACIESLFGDPVFAGDLPDLRTVALRLLPAVAALLVLRLPTHLWPKLPLRPEWLAAFPAFAAVHIAYKHVFALDTASEFVARGLAERTVWEGLLLAAGWLLASRVTLAGRILMAAALAHFLVYSGLLHNPLWTHQEVGAWPLANLFLPAYALGLGSAWLLRPALAEKARPWLDGLIVALAALSALSLLRQAFAGSLPVAAPLTQAEDLLRSLLGILLALLFLFVGSRRGERSWRVGSLVLMVLTAIKVFYYDTAGLEGLLRIASLMALGFSLIGIGWLYSRQLRAAPTAAE